MSESCRSPSCWLAQNMEFHTLTCSLHTFNPGFILSPVISFLLPHIDAHKICNLLSLVKVLDHVHTAVLGLISFLISIWYPCVNHLRGSVDQVCLDKPPLTSNLAVRITGLTFSLFICFFHRMTKHKAAIAALWKVVMAIVPWPYANFAMIWLINLPLHTSCFEIP